MDNTVEVLRHEHGSAEVRCPERVCAQPFTVSIAFARYGTVCPHCKGAKVVYLPGSGTARRVL
jgi:hypothetical protein